MYAFETDNEYVLSGTGALVTFEKPQSLPEGISISYELLNKNSDTCFSGIIKNTSGRDLTLGDIDLFAKVVVELKQPLDRIFVECRDLLGTCGIQYPDRSYWSWGVLGFCDTEGSNAVLLGFEHTQDAFYRFEVTPENSGQYTVRVVCPREQTVLPALKELTLPLLYVYSNKSLSNLLERHAKHMAEYGNARVPKKLKTGWCSWYHYYGLENQQDIIDNIKSLAASPLADKIKVIQLDDGWNLRSNEHPCVWGDWEAGNKFPLGMKAIVDIIHEHGFEAGLWLAPFAVAKDSMLRKEHPEYLLGASDGLLNNGSDVYSLDLTHPGVQKYLKDTFTRVFDEWGYDYIKIDFLLYGASEGKRYDNTQTGAQAFRKGMEIIRECAKDRFVLNCGSPCLQSIGLCDAMRIGSDVSSIWHFPLNEAIWQFGNCSIKPSVKYTASRNWMNGYLWQNDPDCIVVRGRENGIECDQFTKFFKDFEINKDMFGLSEEEALHWVRMVCACGGMKLLSENYEFLNEKEKQLLLDCFSTEYSGMKVVDSYKYNDLFVTVSKDEPLTIHLFNISDELRQVSLDASKFGITNWSFCDKLSNESFSGNGNTIEFPVLLPRSSRSWRLK